MMDDGQAAADDALRQPVSWVAKRTVDRRLGRVVRLFPKAAEHPEQDVAYVHDLRVAIRRATAALQMFSACLPRSPNADMKSQLKRVRRAAGPARDLDVLEERLSRLAASGGATVQLVAALDEVRRRRGKAGKRLLSEYKRARRRGYKGRARDLSARIAWRGEGPEPALIDWAGGEIRPAIERFVARSSSSNLTDPKALHRMRIAEKRMRYSLELLEGAGGAVEKVAPVVEELQDRLGQISDHDTARGLLLRWRDSSRDEGMREVFSPSRRVRDVAGQLRTRRVPQVVDRHPQAGALLAAGDGPGGARRLRIAQGLPVGRVDHSTASYLAGFAGTLRPARIPQRRDAFSILAHESRSGTVRLKTRAPGRESGSTAK